MGRTTVGVSALVVFAQVRVKSALAVGCTVLLSEASRRVADISVTTTSVVDVHYWLRVDISQIVRGSLLKELESTYTNKVKPKGAVSVTKWENEDERIRLKILPAP